MSLPARKGLEILLRVLQDLTETCSCGSKIRGRRKAILQESMFGSGLVPSRPGGSQAFTGSVHGIEPSIPEAHQYCWATGAARRMSLGRPYLPPSRIYNH